MRFSRLNVYARDESTCQYCGRRLPRSELNLDHVVPRSRGGLDELGERGLQLRRLQPAQGRADPGGGGLRLLRAPARPQWTAVFRAAARRALYRQWMPFLGLVDAAYWNVELRD